jgi:diaminohydroxyphosphoribosylaminopyrimidine deaminase/5-amino-6-(5-phosphoribosylamino)uracil reductase
MINPDVDARFMAAAIALARRGLGLCAPNPAVGALIVKDGAICGRGWTKPGGRPHAETVALREAGQRARGATLYVTLEPCSHHGKTPPCAEAVIKAGIVRVVSAVEDPDPRVSGRGYRLLKDAGIEVTAGVLAEAALRANLGHILRVTNQRPMVTLKLALTSDGFAGGGDDQPRLAITGSVANGLVHILRSMHDAILVGCRTVLTDDPLLNVRLPGLEARKPLRVVLDSNLSIPLSSRLVATAAAYPTLIIAGDGAPESAVGRLKSKHVEVALAPRDEAGRVDLAAALSHLAARGVTRVFCEGGPTIAQTVFSAALADEVLLFKSPKALGRPGVAGLTELSAAALADPRRYRTVETRSVGDDSLTRSERVL